MYYHTERNHQRKDNVLLFPQAIVISQPIQYSVANDWVAYFATTIGRRHGGVDEFFDHAGSQRGVVAPAPLLACRVPPPRPKSFD